MNKSGELIDFHCHILPGLDDGSKDEAMSLAMLDQMAAQGIHTIVATPHFYPDRDDLQRFLKRRAQAVERLKTVYKPGLHPKVFIGAEVAYFYGISHAEQLRKLCIEGTDDLLLEMPFFRWSAEDVAEVFNMEDELGIHPVLAHIERYARYQKRATLLTLVDSGIWMQSNASFFLNGKTDKQAFRMLKKGVIHLLGSDCHNMTDRSPELGAAMEKIADAGYTDEIKAICDRGKKLLEEACCVIG